MVTAALGRVSAERAALDVQRDTRRHAESLPTLTARLADLDAWIKREAPPDRSRELTRAAHDLDQARQHCRPGHLTRAGRDDRRHLDAAHARHDRLASEQQERDDWFADNADTLRYRDQLAATLADRRVEQSIARMIIPPDHVGSGLASEPVLDRGGHDPANAARRYRGTWGAEKAGGQDDVGRHFAREFAARLGDANGPARTGHGVDDDLGLGL